MATIVCANCGTVNDDSNTFCQSCGKALAQPIAEDKTVVVKRTKATPPPTPVVAVPPPQVKTEVPPAPPAPVASVPPVPMPPPVQAAPVSMPGTPVHKLGIRSDGWSDIIEDAASQEEEVKKLFVEGVKAANIPGLVVSESLISNGTATRKYHVVYNGSGANVLVRVAPFGKNLVASWELYTKRKVNWLTLAIIGGAVFVIALLYVIISKGFFGGFFGGLFSLISLMLSWLLVPTLAVMLFAKIIKDDWLGFFVQDLDEFAADDAMALSSVVDSALAKAIETARALTQKAKK